MSKVNIRRLVDNIRSGTNVYTPLIEWIVNAMQGDHGKCGCNAIARCSLLLSFFQYE